MKLLLDFLPIVIFFAVYQFTGDLIVATAVLIPVTIVQVAVIYLVTRTLEKMALATMLLVVVFGGLTVLLNDGWFIMWKPTVVNMLFASAFLASHFIGDKPLVERLLGHVIGLPKQRWIELSYAWVAFFTFSAILNLVIAYQFSEEFWVNFKLFGSFSITLAFLIAQGFWISRHGTEIETTDQTES